MVTVKFLGVTKNSEVKSLLLSCLSDMGRYSCQPVVVSCPLLFKPQSAKQNNKQTKLTKQESSQASIVKEQIKHIYSK